MKKSMSIRWDEELLDRVDAVRGDVSRARWIQRAIEQRLDRETDRADFPGSPVSGKEASDGA